MKSKEERETSRKHRHDLHPIFVQYFKRLFSFPFFSSFHPFRSPSALRWWCRFAAKMHPFGNALNAVVFLSLSHVETQGPTGSTTVIVIWAAADEIMSVQSHNWIWIGLGFWYYRTSVHAHTRTHAGQAYEKGNGFQMYNCGRQKGAQYVSIQTSHILEEKKKKKKMVYNWNDPFGHCLPWFL